MTLYSDAGTVERHALIRPEQSGWFQGTDCLRLRLKVRDRRQIASYCFLGESHKQWIMNQLAWCDYDFSQSGYHQSNSCPASPPDPAQNRRDPLRLRRSDRDQHPAHRAPGGDSARAVSRVVRALPVPGSRGRAAGRVGGGVVAGGVGGEGAGGYRRCQRSRNQEGLGTGTEQLRGYSSVSPGKIDKIEAMLFVEAPGSARRIVKHGDIIWSTVRPNRRSML